MHVAVALGDPRVAQVHEEVDEGVELRVEHALVEVLRRLEIARLDESYSVQCVVHPPYSTRTGVVDQ
jgi:hypothetical protein